MADDILQRFLSDKLFDVRGNDEQLNLIRTAAGDLADALKAAPARIPAFTMVAIDAGVPPDEPLLAEVGRALQVRWNSYRGAFSDSVLPTIFRAMILTALDRLVGSEPAAAAVATTCRNLLPHLASAVDAPLWADLVTKAGHRLEARARREWALPSSTAGTMPALEMPGTGLVAETTLNRDWLIKQMRAAGGPHDSQSTAIEGANPYWPNQGEAWVHEFAPRAAKAVVLATNSALKLVVENVNAALTSQERAATIGEYVRTMAESIAQTSAGLERRTSLMWWRQALFSPSAEIGYRDVPPSVAAALVALDASAQAGPFAPRMAEAFVVETVRDLETGDGNEATIGEHLAALARCDPTLAKAAVEPFARFRAEAGRTTLSSLIGVRAEAGADETMRRLGMQGETTLPASGLALWLFRELQAHAALPAAVPRVRKPKKG